MIEDAFDIWLGEKYGHSYLYDKWEMNSIAYGAWRKELLEAFKAGCDFMEGRDPVVGF